MLFNSLEFILLFLPPVFLLARALKGQALLAWLSLASAIFYAFCGHAWFVVPMLVTTTLDYFIALRMQRNPRHKNGWLVFSLVCNLSLLGFFKYAGLLANTIERAAGLLHLTMPAAAAGVSVAGKHFSFSEMPLPPGISFYTFQTISYVVDVWRGQCRAERNFFRFAGFVFFFPHLVAGPLTRHHQLIPQLEAAARKGIAPRWKAASFCFAWGLVKKLLIADTIARGIDPLLAHIAGLSTAQAWFALIGFSLQIYFDFSGYSDMAIGLGRLFAIELPVNFRNPYLSADPSEFWTRWHITLSSWLRDYLYIPLGGNRGSSRQTARNLLITMALGGLWHGASWTFLLWGLFHGAWLVALRPFRAQWDEIARPLRQLVTFAGVSLGWVFFRAPGLRDVGHWFRALAGFGIHPASSTVDRMACAAIAVGFAVILAAPLKTVDWEERLAVFESWALGVATALAILGMNLTSRFLYFQF